MTIPTQPTVTVTNLQISPMQIFWKPPGGSSFVDLGASLKNIKVEIKTTKAPMKADQYGGSVLDESVSGHEVKISTELAEILDKTKWQVVFPNGVLTTSGGTSAFDIRNAVGARSLPLCGTLKLHPLALDVTDTSLDFMAYKAIATAESNIGWGPTEQATLPITWMILPDTAATGNGARWLRIGDPTL